MAEIAGDFSQEPDPMWYEVSSQIYDALDSHEFAAIIQDREVYYVTLPSDYNRVGQVFSNSRVFWTVTGWRLRPKVIYEVPGVEGCDLKVE